MNAQNTKNQNPNTKETPIIKHQSRDTRLPQQALGLGV